MGHNSVPMLPISNPIGPVGPVANCLNPYPEKSGFRIRKIQKSGFFESCRARYELSIRTYDAKNKLVSSAVIRSQNSKIKNKINIHFAFSERPDPHQLKFVQFFSTQPISTYFTLQRYIALSAP